MNYIKIIQNRLQYPIKVFFLPASERFESIKNLNKYLLKFIYLKIYKNVTKRAYIFTTHFLKV